MQSAISSGVPALLNVLAWVSVSLFPVQRKGGKVKNLNHGPVHRSDWNGLSNFVVDKRCFNHTRTYTVDADIVL